MRQSLKQTPRPSSRMRLKSIILLLMSGIGVAITVTAITFFYLNVGNPGRSVADIDEVLNKRSVQWAAELQFQSNNYGEEEFSGHQVLGPPDAFPFGVTHRNAFRLKKEKDQGEITVAYQHPTQVEQIIIVENNLTDRVEQIILHDTEGKKHQVYSGESSIDNLEELPARIMNLKIEKTEYNVKMITVHFNTLDKGGWAQIDAIGICENALSNEQFDQLMTMNASYTEQPVQFTEAREKLGKNINTVYKEAKPVISPDGRYMYFTRQNAPENYMGTKDDQDIYYSEYVNGEWTEAKNIGAPLNDKYPNGVCAISKDGKKLWVLNAYNKDGSVENGISVTHLQEDGAWTKPQKLEIDDFYNLGVYQDYYMCSDEQTLLLAVQRADTRGDQDLYVSFRKEEGGWSKPANLGTTVNSDLSEYAPYLSPGGKVLYFSSNGHAQNGKSKIYYSIRQDETWQKWSDPQPVSKHTDDNRAEAYFTMSPDMQVAYIVCAETINVNNQKKPDKNIYKVQLEMTNEVNFDELLANLKGITSHHY